jgi:phosphatidylethanolamine-binding protein (PEBP) family uncharacterized protein
MLFGFTTMSIAARQRGTPAPAGARLRLTSSGFSDRSTLPLTFVCYNNGGMHNHHRKMPYRRLSPGQMCPNAASFALTLNGPDNHPKKGIDMKTFWVIWNIPPTTTELPQGVKLGAELPGGARQATGQRESVGYRAPVRTGGCRTFALFIHSLCT